MFLDKSEFQDENNYIPEWHIAILKERLKSLEEGSAVFYDWEDVKETIFKVEDTNGKSNQN